MKKLIVVLVLLAAALGGGWWYLNQPVDLERPADSSPAGSPEGEVEQIQNRTLSGVESKLAERLSPGGPDPAGSSPEASDDTPAADDPVLTDDPATPAAADTPVPDGATPATASDKEQVLVEVYNEAFADLQAEANAVVEGLLAGAMADYAALEEQGKASKDQLLRLGNSYLKRANAMEAQMDSCVEAVIAQMRADMTAQGVDPAAIDGYAQQYRSAYEAQKAARRSELMGKAKGLI